MRAGTKAKHLFEAAFTLLELLVVIAIMAALMGLAASVTQGVSSSSELTSASGQVVAIFNRAREVAITKNETVQVRIYDRGGVYNEISVGVIEAPEDPGDADYNTPANFDFDKLENHFVLPEGIVFLGSPYSTVITGISSLPSSERDVLTGTETVGGTTLDYSAITFSPKRRILLSSDESLLSGERWTLTIATQASVYAAGSVLPDNYATVQLNPSSAKATVIRP